MKTGVLLVNLGTPDSPSVPDVRKYLTQFLNDPRVIDISPAGRFFLVNGIIVPFRASKSAKLYQEIWTERGSPLLFHTTDLTTRLQESLGANFQVEFAMRYQNPSIESVLEKFRKAYVKKLIIIPLYPQYASSSTGSTIEAVTKALNNWQVVPETKYISQFYDDPGFLDALIEIASRYDLNAYDHYLFSFHGLPERQIKKADCYGNCLVNPNCCDEISFKNHHCYRATCFETARLIAGRLNIPTDKYTVCFQSRLGKDPWIKPYSDYVIKEQAEKGSKKMLVFSPAFVADCLETIYEIGVEYDELFKEHGGEKVQLVESLNSHPAWVKALHEMVIKAC